MTSERMKTGYVYVLALNGWFGRVHRLEKTLRDPASLIPRFAAAGSKKRHARLLGYEFVEDLTAASAQIRADLRRARVKGHARTFRCSAAAARQALRRAARRQAALRKAHFHPQTGLLQARDVELAGPILAFADRVTAELAPETGDDLSKLDVFLHPYMLGTITSLFQQEQPRTKIPDAYLPEIMREIAWRTFRCRLKPGIFMRMARRTRREQSYVDLARYAFTHPRHGSSASQLASFVERPEAHLGEVMQGYAQALTRAPQVKLRNFMYRLLQIAMFIGMAFGLDAVMAGAGPDRWLAALLVLFFLGGAAFAFNLYERPDLTGGLGILTRKEVERELAALQRGLKLG